MKLLLDTHTFLWLLTSVVVAWEIQIKRQLGKLELDDPLTELIQSQQDANALQVLPVSLDHVLELDNLARHHKDPFDRLLIAQARVESCHLVTSDRVIPTYSMAVLW